LKVGSPKTQSRQKPLKRGTGRRLKRYRKMMKNPQKKKHFIPEKNEGVISRRQNKVEKGLFLGTVNEGELTGRERGGDLAKKKKRVG